MKVSREKIDVAMAKNCMTITSLAEAYGVSRVRMQAILNQREITPICAGRLSAALQVPIESLLEN